MAHADFSGLEARKSSASDAEVMSGLKSSDANLADYQIEAFM